MARETDLFANSKLIEFENQLNTPTPYRLQELIKLGTLFSHNLFQTLITNQDLLRLREDMWPNHKTTRFDLNCFYYWKQ